MFRTFTAAAVIALTVTAAQAGSVTVNLKGLDLSDASSSTILGQRIQLAAEQACGPVDYTSDGRGGALVEARDRHQDCVRHASRQAVAVLRSQPRLARAAAVVKLASN